MTSSLCGECDWGAIGNMHVLICSYVRILIFFQAGTASFYPPVSHEIKQQLKAHLVSITKKLPEDLQFVLKNS